MTSKTPCSTPSRRTRHCAAHSTGDSKWTRHEISAFPGSKQTPTPVPKKDSTRVPKQTSIPGSKQTPTPVPKQGSTQCQAGHQVGFLSGSHGELVVASGCQVTLTGVNWFGFETSSFSPHGLGVRNWQDMLKQIAHEGFNTLRLPYTNQLFDSGSVPNGINYQLNPDLKGLQGLALMDRIIQGARKVGMKVVLDRHDPTADLRPPLWYTGQIPQPRWINDWVILAPHYPGNDPVIAADLDTDPPCPPSGRSIGAICKRMGLPRYSWESSEGPLWARTWRACGSVPWCPTCTRRASAMPTGPGTLTRGIPAASSTTTGRRSTRARWTY